MNTKEHISKFLEPDDIWWNFGAKTQEEFVEKFITKGKFHKNVPEKIKNDYQIVERLQFYSYYNYPLVDQAFAKSTRIFEASIDLKIVELKMEKQGFEPLNSKIKRLENFTSNELHKKWVQAKEMRNLFAHHKAGRLMGVTLLKAFKHNVNMINSIFLDKEEILEKENSLKNLIQKSSHLKSGLFILNYNSTNYLVWSMIPYSTSIKEDDEKSFWVFHPVYKKKPITEVSDFPDAFKLNLKNLNISNEGLTANVVETNERIMLQKTEKEENIKQYDDHLIQMIETDLKLKEMYFLVLQNDINRKVTEFIYNYNW